MTFLVEPLQLLASFGLGLLFTGVGEKFLLNSLLIDIKAQFIPCQTGVDPSVPFSTTFLPVGVRNFIGTEVT